MNGLADSARLAHQHALGETLDRVYGSARADRSGEVASYIPELGTVAPDQFGLAVAHVSGQMWSVGDAQAEFTIQSVSKAFAYCLALELHGRDTVNRHVGVEPSGDAFNAIVFDPRTNRPFNPMVNAGAITISSLIHGHAGGEAMHLLLDRLSRAAGRPLHISESVYQSEAATGHRNRAIAHLLVSAGAAVEPVEPALDLYFRQCSILVHAQDLAWMGATLANMGTNPFTGDSVFDLAAVRDTLAVMFTCGMYDASGHWAVDVGIPAKSGVGGGIVGVFNRQIGIGSFAPRLDAQGNSVRSLRAFRSLSDELGLHAFECTNLGSEYLRLLA
jgi:glutaminase